MKRFVHPPTRHSGENGNLLAVLKQIPAFAGKTNRVGLKQIPAFAGMTIIVLVLSACSGSNSLLEKPAPQPVNEQSLIRPPWEAMVKAGPGAEKELDLETLNGPNPHPLLMGGQVPTPADGAQTAQAAPAPDANPSVAAPPELAAKAAAPNANATPIKAVAVLGVSGASPQGDKELTAAMRKILKQSGWPVLDRPRKDALNIQGTVALEAAQGANQTVRLDWVVTAPRGKVLGHVSQANQVPAHSLDASWGAAAGYATQAAADGIFKLIGQYR